MERIIDKIREATNDTYIGQDSTSTLLGWVPKYDDQGRILNVNPNYIDSTVIVDNVKYFITKHGWKVYVWKDEQKYTILFNDTKLFANLILDFIDLTPDYIKEYYKNNK